VKATDGLAEMAVVWTEQPEHIKAAMKVLLERSVQKMGALSIIIKCCNLMATRKRLLLSEKAE